MTVEQADQAETVREAVAVLSVHPGVASSALLDVMWAGLTELSDLVDGVRLASAARAASEYLRGGL